MKTELRIFTKSANGKKHTKTNLIVLRTKEKKQSN